MAKSEDMMQALVSKLYGTITGNDPNVKIPRNKYVTWLLPGIPFTPDDFKFCEAGLVSTSENAAAEETLKLYHQAFVLSKLFDLIPDVNNEFVDSNMQQHIFASTQDSISSVYKDVLKFSKVLNDELSDEEKAKLEKFRKLLVVQKETEDLITGEKKTVTEPGPITKAYNAKLSEYLDAADEYMSVFINAQSAKGSDPEAVKRVLEFNNKSKYLRKKLEAAEMAWVSEGYKNEYEQINAYINHVTQRSLVLYKQDLLNRLNYGVLTSAADGGSDFYYTTLIPGNFAKSEGWTKFSFYEGDYESHYNKKTSQWSAGAGAGFGLWSVGGGVNSSSTQIKSDMELSNFSATFEFTQIPICRPWFEPGFFSMKSWTLDETWDLSFNGKKLSDGADKPTGRLVAYPVSALFVRNVSFSSSDFASHHSSLTESFSASARVGWGPFSVSGSYSKGEEKVDTKMEWSGNSINIQGMQLIGFINNIIPKSPDPNPDIKPEQFI